MKADNPSAPWAEILAVTTSFKSAGEVKARFKEIQHQDAQGKPDQSKVTKEKDLDLDKEGRAAKNREEGLKKQAEEKAKKEAEGKAEKEKAGPPKDNEKVRCTTPRYRPQLIKDRMRKPIPPNATRPARARCRARRNGRSSPPSTTTRPGNASALLRPARWPKQSDTPTFRAMMRRWNPAHRQPIPRLISGRGRCESGSLSG